MRSRTHTLVIIGGGFSGTVLASQLLRNPPAGPIRVVLVERAAALGRGVAYRRASHPHLLNVPAARMSADSADAGQFLRFAQRTRPDSHAEDFLPRALYGDYLQELLQNAQAAAPSSVTFERIQGEAHAVQRIATDGPYLVSVAERQRFLADDVVLACGDPPPATPAFIAGAAEHRAYVRDPFSDGALRADTSTLLLVGTGLTMADMATTAAASNPSIRIHALSRHGLLPAPQSGRTLNLPLTHRWRPLPRASLTTRQLLGWFRSLIREAESLGGDWRDAVTTARHEVPQLWQALPPVERRRFLRHLRARWDVHRHRLPLPVAERLEQLRARGQLELHAGHIQSVHYAGSQLRVSWQPRGGAATRELLVDQLVNCTGPDRRLADTRDPLWRSLLDSGLCVAEPLGLGLATDAHGALLDADGRVAPHLFYLGPMLRATFWEATAVGELRGHAERLARTLSGSVHAWSDRPQQQQRYLG